MSKTILIIEDDDVIVNILEKIIQSIGYTPEHAYSIYDARAMIKVNAPKLILLDLNLDGERGHELFEIEGKNPLLTNIPVIFLTASKAKSDVIIGKSRGVVDYIIKPFNGKYLIERIKKAIA